MSLIHLETLIDTFPERAFDLNRSVEFHLMTAAHTDEKVLEGRKGGLFEEGDEVLWQGRHLGVRQKFRVRIIQVEDPLLFVDEMVSGAFKRFRHEHIFRPKEGKTLMIDRLDYEPPLGVLGKFADRVFLYTYLRNFLKHRAEVLREYAESDRWQEMPGVR